jgi:serine/threonine protein kinase
MGSDIRPSYCELFRSSECFGYNRATFMDITIGQRLGSYEVTALLGKVGMGEVYRACDVKLKREVAIKILPEEFSRDSVRMIRFQREAEVLESLNHPNIARVYGVDECCCQWSKGQTHVTIRSSDITLVRDQRLAPRSIIARKVIISGDELDATCNRADARGYEVERRTREADRTNRFRNGTVPTVRVDRPTN